MNELVTLSKARLKLARIMADMLDTRADGHASKTVWVEDQNYIAFRGEQMVLTALQNKVIEYAPKVDGNGDQGDLLLHFKNGLVIPADVKTASQPSHQYLFVPRIQTKHKILPIYIAARLENETSGFIDGYCHPEDLAVDDEYHHSPLSNIDVLWQRTDWILELGWLADKLLDGKPIETYPVEVMARFKSEELTPVGEPAPH
jgi:hypothetical protein